ncbi:MAG: energy-coupling factor ABC transporter ATP-binding protein, partial [Candidatus Heimdallarchaeota archaeon]
ELEFGPKNLGIKDEELSKLALDIAKEFQITHLLEKNPLELSGGERRLVSIASVLTMNQQILVLDEPSFGQDYRQKKRLGLFLQSLTERGVTVLIVSHDIDFILDFAPRLIVLKDGTIIADGKTRDILSNKSLIEESDLDVPLLLELQEELKTVTDKASTFTDEASTFQFIMNLITKKEKRG